MATTISSGTNPYKLGSPPDFGTLYSGRALEFDGVADYVDCGNIAPIVSYSGTGGDDFTYSFWFNSDKISSYPTIFSARGSDGRMTVIYFQSNYLYFDITESGADNAFIRSTDTVSTGRWYHAVITFDSSAYVNDTGHDSMKMYLDGVDVTPASSGAPPGVSATTNKTYIGYPAAGGGSYYEGELSNFQVWNKIWSLSDVQYAYTHPEKLVTDRQGGGVLGLASFNISNLKAWYPCTEGNPRSPQTTVYDGSPKELGSDKISSPDFTSASGLTFTQGSTGTLTLDTSAGTVTATDDVQDGYLTWSGAGLVENKLYRLQVVIDSYVGGRFRTTSGWGNGTNFYPSVSSSPQTHTQYFLGNSTSAFAMQCDDGAPCEWVISNVSVKEVQMGNHGTTTFTEVIEEDDCADDDRSDWTHTGTSSTLAFDTDRYEHGNEGVNSYVYNEFSGTRGDVYKVEFKVLNKDVAGDFDVNATYYNGSSYTEGSTVTIDSSSVAYTTVNHTFTADATSATSRWGIKVQSDLGRKKIKLQDFSITHIGVASGWTTADAEPLIPQTALMGMSKPMIFDGIDDVVTVSSTVPARAVEGDSFTVSAWVINPNTSDTSTRCWISINDNDSASNRFQLNHNTSNDYLYYKCEDGTEVNWYVSGQNINDGKWHHIVLVNTSTTSRTLYVDGSSIGTNTTDSTQPTSVFDKVVIGGYKQGSSSVTSFWNGCINEVAIWDDDLSLAEVQAIFNDGVALDVSSDSGDYASSGDLVGYWRNDGVSTWTDRSTNSNNGTPAGSPDTILLPEGTTTGKDILGFPLTHTNNGWLNLDANQVNDSEGTTPYVLCPVPSGSPLDLTQLFTIEAWVKIDKEGYVNYIAGNWVGSDRGWHLGISEHSPPKLSFSWTTDGEWGTNVSKSTASGISNLVGNWRHIVCIYNMGVVSFYIDTVAQSITTPDQYDGQTIWSARNLTIGRGYAYWEGMKGQVDEVKIYNRALSLTEITKNYKFGLAAHD